MNQCPSRDQLRQLLTEELNPAERNVIETHIEACETCQEVLPTLVADPEMERWRVLLESGAEEQEQHAELVQRLTNQPFFAGAVAPGMESLRGSSPIHFPGPPTDRGPLGQLESFQIQKELGHGGMGFVFQAYDERLRRTVAIKVMKPELAALDTHRKRFAREARAVAGIKHEHVVAIHDLGDLSDFSPYLVMEYIEGESLSNRLKHEEPLALRQAAELTRQVALGLAAAHEQGVLHRDIKPANILLEKTSGRAKIADFGLARMLESFDDSISQPGHLIGTPAYMSPEQLAAPDKVDARSDVYSLGVVLYELLTGERPHRGDGQALLLQVVHEAARPPRQLDPNVPVDLETICLMAMAKSQHDRYQSVTELAEDLRLDGQKVEARPIAKPTRSSTSRKMTVAILGFLLVVGALATYSITTDYGQLIIQAEKDVEVRVLRGGEEVEIIDTKTKKMLRLKSGKYELELVRGVGGLTLSTDQFVLTRGKEEIVKVTRAPAPPRAVPGRGYQESASAWEILPAIGFPRDHAMIVAASDRFFILGGLDVSDAALSHVREYWLGQGSWRAKAPLPEPRHSGAVGLAKNQILVAGGWVKSMPGVDPVTTNTLVIYNIEQDRWSKGPDMPTKSGSSIGGVIGNKFYVVTGNDGGNAVNLFHVFDIGNRVWKKLPSPPHPHELGAGAVMGGKLYVVGGNNSLEGKGNTRDLDVYDPEMGWETKAPMPTARWSLGTAVVQGKLYAVGGAHNQEALPTVERYDPAADTWESIPSLQLRMPRFHLSVVSVGNNLYAVGGHDGKTSLAAMEVLKLK